MLKIDQISALHIELTTNCNARCPMCMRNYCGYDFNSGYPITELKLSDIKKIFSIEFLKQIKKVNFNGNLGDFGLAKDAVDIVNYFLQNSKAEIQIETNGSMRTPAWWAQLANSRVKILWALDGLADTHSLYRQDTVWQHVIDNARAFICAGGKAVWKFIPFDHNRHQLQECKELSKNLGFAEFVVYDQGRSEGPVFTRNGEFSHWLGSTNKRYWLSDDKQVTKVENLIEHHLTWFDPKKPVAWIKNEAAEIDCKHIKLKEIYVAANGTVYPCCWLGYYPETMKHPGNSQILPLIKNNNALEHSLEECLEWFDAVEQSWKQKSIADGKLYSCLNSCTINQPVL